MIEKFVKIEGIGKFNNFNAKGNIAFKKVTIIYGENGIGKTTLASILKSLKTNDSLIQQKSFGFAQNQSVKILNNGNTITYSETGKWTNNVSDIEIFDIHFINENIFTGAKIDNEHQKNVFNFVIGNEGVELNEEIENIKSEISGKNKEISDLEKIILSHFKNKPVDEIKNISNEENVDEKINSLKEKIEKYKDFQKIKNTEPLKEIKKLEFGNIQFENTKSFLQETINSISQEYLKEVENHKAKLGLKENPEHWLKNGYESNLYSQNVCPFCLREIDSTQKIIIAYNQYFNKEYLKMQGEASELIEKINSLSLEKKILEIEKSISLNSGNVNFWETYIKTQKLEYLDFSRDFLIELEKEFRKIVENKKNNLLQSVDIEKVSGLEQNINIANEKISNYNLQVKSFNEKISLLKREILDVANLNQELNRLETVKKRYSNEISELCNNHNNLKNELKSLETQKDEKVDKLKKDTETFFETYTKKINEYLNYFASYIKIKKESIGYIGKSKTASFKYSLFVSDNEISRNENSDKPSFKNCLSEGDKSALALSFFFAKLELSEKLAQSIIVFDDPISSFDMSRKTKTISKLINFSENVKQIIILSHNFNFVRELYEGVNNKNIEYKILKLNFKNSTQIVELNVDSEFKSQYFKNIDKLEDFLRNGASDDDEKRNIATLIRPTLEEYFRFRFYKYFKNKEWLGDFLEKIRSSNAGGPLYSLKSDEELLNNINDFSKPYHHSNPNFNNEPINGQELKDFVKDTLDLVNKV